MQYESQSGAPEEESDGGDLLVEGHVLDVPRKDVAARIATRFLFLVVSTILRSLSTG